MKVLSILGPILLATAAHAGVVHGTITAEGRPLVDTPVSVTCPDGDTYPGHTNERGRYSVNVQRQGKCTFNVTFQEQLLESTVFSYPDPVQYDFEIVHEDGRWVLRRK